MLRLENNEPNETSNSPLFRPRRHWKFLHFFGYVTSAEINQHDEAIKKISERMDKIIREAQESTRRAQESTRRAQESTRRAQESTRIEQEKTRIAEEEMSGPLRQLKSLGY